MSFYNLKINKLFEKSVLSCLIGIGWGIDPIN